MVHPDGDLLYYWELRKAWSACTKEAIDYDQGGEKEEVPQIEGEPVGKHEKESRTDPEDDEPPDELNE